MLETVKFKVKQKYIKMDNYYLVKTSYEIEDGVYDYMRSSSDSLARKIMIDKVVNFLGAETYVKTRNLSELVIQFTEDSKADEAAFIMRLNALDEISFTFDVDFPARAGKTPAGKKRSIERFFDEFDYDDVEDEDEDE